jgi:hypothetical protein
MGAYEQVDGQCSTCGFAKGFDYADCPSGPDSVVLCSSIEIAKEQDEAFNNDDPNDPCYNIRQKELAEFGYMNLWRLEALAEKTFRCEHWKPSNAWLKQKKPKSLAK